MCSKNKITYQDEYQTLRDEILQGKKYVFERPLLIVTISVALIQFIDKPFMVYVPILLIPLLAFNLWFTVNRIKSIARIVAYIQLVLEENNNIVWRGWETSLRFYRKWTKLNKDEIAKIIKKSIDQDAAPDAMGYYPVIFYLHIGIVCLTVIFSIIYSVDDSTRKNIASTCITFALSAVYMIFSFSCRPKKIEGGIEGNRVIWTIVLNSIEDNKANQPTQTAARLISDVEAVEKVKNTF